jgi:hypothetical protein
MKFVETWDNTTGVPGFYDWVLRGNSIYDPDFALSADSVYGLAPMAALYTHYKVLSSTISVAVRNNDTDDPVNVAIIPASFSASFAAANQDGVMVHPLCRSTSVSLNDGVKTLRHSALSTVMFDVKDLDSVNFRSECTTNPATQWYWHVVTFNNAGVASDCEMRVTMVYDTIFSGPLAYEQ